MGVSCKQSPKTTHAKGLRKRKLLLWHVENATMFPRTSQCSGVLEKLESLGKIPIVRFRFDLVMMPTGSTHVGTKPVNQDVLAASSFEIQEAMVRAKF